MVGLGNRILELRLEKGLTQPQLAKALMVSNCIISKWENDLMEPKATYICRLCKFFGVTADYLLGLEETNF